MILRYLSTDTGLDRMYYTLAGAKQRVLYCIQPDITGELMLYRCSTDGEPSHTVDASDYIIHFPRIADRSAPTELEVKANEFIRAAYYAKGAGK